MCVLSLSVRGIDFDIVLNKMLTGKWNNIFLYIFPLQFLRKDTKMQCPHK